MVNKVYFNNNTLIFGVNGVTVTTTLAGGGGPFVHDWAPNNVPLRYPAVTGWTNFFKERSTQRHKVLYPPEDVHWDNHTDITITASYEALGGEQGYGLRELIFNGTSGGNVRRIVCT